MGNAVISCFLLVFSLSLFADVEVNRNPLKATGELKQSTLPAGANTTVVIDMKLDPPHIAYSDQFKLEPVQKDLVRISPITVLEEVTFDDVHSKKVKKGIRKFGQLEAAIELAEDYPKGKTEIPLRLTYQACTDEYCLLPITIDVMVSATVTSMYGETPEEDSPKALFKNTVFADVSDWGWIGIFLFVFFSGILTSFTPCVFPVIPMTLAVIGHNSEGKTRLQGFILSFVYVSGIALVYSLLGLVVASSGALFGAYLGHPLFNAGLAVIFFIMALSMFGLFDLEPPLWLQNKLGTRSTGNGYPGAFLAGMIAGLIASPCVGPVLVAILAFVAKTQDQVLGFFLLLTFAYGLGLIFLVLGTFSSLINKLPKSGAWMNRVKYSFGVIMIGLGIYYLQPVYNHYFPSEKVETHGSKLFETYSEAKLVAAKAEGKAVIIDFWADWCAACIQLEKETFPQPEVQALKDKFVFLKYDATSPSGPEFEKLQEMYDIIGLPHLVFYDSEGNYRPELTLTGFENAEKFSQRMLQALPKN